MIMTIWDFPLSLFLTTLQIFHLDFLTTTETKQRSIYSFLSSYHNSSKSLWRKICDGKDSINESLLSYDGPKEKFARGTGLSSAGHSLIIK